MNTAIDVFISLISLIALILSGVLATRHFGFVAAAGIGGFRLPPNLTVFGCQTWGRVVPPTRG